MSAPGRRRYRTILYSRPLVPGLNDSDEHLARAYALSRLADATVFTGLFYRDQIARCYRASGLPEPYAATARRKIVPEALEQRVLAAFAGSASLFRKTSCAVSYAHGLPDYNGHYGIRELCGICPAGQVSPCRSAHRVPSADQIRRMARALPETQGIQVVGISERAAVVSRLGDEQPRYYLQHALGFQMHDVRHPHAAAPHAGVCHVAGADAISRYDLGLLIAWRDGLDPAALPAGLRAAPASGARWTCRWTAPRPRHA